MAISFGVGRGLLIPKGQPVAGIATDNLISVLDFGNSLSYAGTGTSVSDISGNSNNLTLFGSPLTFGNTEPKSMGFNSGSYGRFNNNSTWNSVTNFTASVWINVANATQGGIISHLGGLFEFFMYNGSFYFRCNGLTTSAGSKVMITANNMNTNVWTLLTITYDGLTLKIYKNGISYASQSCVRASLSVTTAPVIISGAWETLPGSSAGYPLNGKISSIRLHSRALTSSEISTLYTIQRVYFGV